jgi:spermidine synthase
VYGRFVCRARGPEAKVPFGPSPLSSPAELKRAGVLHLLGKDLPCNGKPRLIDMPSPFALEPGTVRLVAPAEGLSEEQLERLREGTLGRPFIIDYGRTRNLFFTLDAVQSSMRLDDPNALVAPYTRKMMAFLLFIPAPRHVLMIGLGGGSLAKFCYRHLPRTCISVVEINPDVIALREAFAIPDDDQRFEIINDDGARFLAKGRVRPDIILVDAFDATGVAPSLASSDFYKRASQCMTPDGVLVMNLAGERARYAAHIESLRVAFPEAIRLVPVDGDDNVILFACRGRQVVDLPDVLSNRAHHLERGLGLQFSRFLERLHAGEILNTGSAPSKHTSSGTPQCLLDSAATPVSADVRVLA